MRKLFQRQMAEKAKKLKKNCQNSLWRKKNLLVKRKMVERHKALRELTLARALYRCGDHKGLAEKTLKEFALDLRGVCALHATALLKRGKNQPLILGIEFYIDSHVFKIAEQRLIMII